MHVDETVLRPLRERYGTPTILRWEGELSEQEWQLATYNPERTHDVTLFVVNGDRLALIRKPHFTEGIWRTPGGGIKPGEDFVAGAVREAYEETGLHVELDRYLVDAQVRFTWDGRQLAWRTHVVSATTDDEEIDPAGRGRDRRRALGNGGGAPRPCPRDAPRNRTRALALPRRAPRRVSRGAPCSCFVGARRPDGPRSGLRLQL